MTMTSNANNMTDAVRLQAANAHAEHRLWASDIACWNDDIENWRSEHSHAIDQLQEALRQITDHGKCLDDHASSVATLQKDLERHEKSLAVSLQDDSCTELDPKLQGEHEKEAGVHTRQHDAHERMKKHHHQAMAKVAMLAKALEAAC